MVNEYVSFNFQLENQLFNYKRKYQDVMVNVYLNFSDETKRMDLSPNYEVVLSSRRDLSSPPREILPFEAIVLVKKG